MEILRPDKWLFICSANIARSPTAEYLARKRGMIARSCGTGGRPGEYERYAVTPMTHEILQWADVIVCMKDGHRLAVEAMHSCESHAQKLFVWALEDDWGVPYHRQMIAIMEPKLLQSKQEYEEWRA